MRRHYGASSKLVSSPRLRSDPWGLLVAGTLLLTPGCKEVPDDVAQCPASGGGSGGCADTDAPSEAPDCAEPAFDSSSPPNPVVFECEGRAGGALVYNQVMYAGKGGPDFVETDPPETEFPEPGPEVSACCEQGTQDVDENGCQRDCGRAACNRVLDLLRNRLEEVDASDGACDDLIAPGPIEGCQDRVRTSIEKWVSELELKYDKCVEAAILNSDALLDYTEHDEPFGDKRKVTIDDPSCDQNAVGCLWQAELRPFCQIDDATQSQESCQMAGNPEDENADGGADGGTTAGGGGVDSFGDVQQLIWCDGRDCIIENELTYNMGYNFHVFDTEGVTWTLDTFATGVTGVKITGLDSGEDSAELLSEFGLRNGDVITHVNSVALDSWEDAIAVLEDVENETYWAVTVRRFRCLVSCSWTTLDYEIWRSVSFAQNAAATPDESATGSHGCGCAQPGGPAPLGGVLGLLALFGCRRRARRAS